MDTFVKYAPSPMSRGCEAEGLRALQSLIDQLGIDELRTPQIYEEKGNELILERIAVISSQAELMVNLGRGLARLHCFPQEAYGWGRDNFIGLNPQKNSWQNTWGEFFCEYRLRPQIAMIANEAVRNEFELILSKCEGQLVLYLNDHCSHASLVHGDLWSGNVMFSPKGVYLIDPAIYCGDREVDLAMTEMFGGFGPQFYEAYQQELGTSSEYSRKKVIYNLYHYLNHYNLFGGGYLSSCREGFSLIEKLFSKK